MFFCENVPTELHELFSVLITIVIILCVNKFVLGVVKFSISLLFSFVQDSDLLRRETSNSSPHTRKHTLVFVACFIPSSFVVNTIHQIVAFLV